ncbi:MAG: histidine kinase [Bacteroidetes bacterium]|nr:histidine kinase [Bacteroidota bacterium]
MFANRNRFIFILILSVYSYLNTLFSEVYAYYGISANWYIVLLFFVVVTLVIWEGNKIIGDYLSGAFREIKFNYFIVFFAIGVFYSALVSAGITYLFGLFFIRLPTKQLNISLKLAVTYGTRINLFLHVLNGILYYANQFRMKEMETAELKRMNAQAQLQNIKSQVNPHFLFNNLNVLSALVMKEHPDANRFIEEFSKVYRHVLSSQQHELIPLKSEIEFLEPYIFLLKKRFPESIYVNNKISPEYLDHMIIPVAVQMLIENATKHNVASKSKPLYIDLFVDPEFRLAVMNNLQPRSVASESGHIGLNNISKRYQLITGKEIEIRKSEKTFIVYLPLIQSK